MIFLKSAVVAWLTAAVDPSHKINAVPHGEISPQSNGPSRA
jgi:hypothetical protein